MIRISDRKYWGGSFLTVLCLEFYGRSELLVYSELHEQQTSYFHIIDIHVHILHNACMMTYMVLTEVLISSTSYYSCDLHLFR
jgi:hypothetical protein